MKGHNVMPETTFPYNTEASLWTPGNFPVPSAVRVQNGALIRDGEIVAQFLDTDTAVLVLRSVGWEIETAQAHPDGDVVQLVNYAVK